MHALAGAQRGEFGFFFVVLGADLGERAVTTEAHGEWPTTFRIDTQLARACGIGAINTFDLVVDLRLERGPELLQQRHPFFFATADRIQFVFELGGEVVVDVAGEMAGQEFSHRAADIAWSKAAAVERDVLA